MERKGYPKAAPEQAHYTTSAKKSPLCPRQRRLLVALREGPVHREEADRICRASNSPDVVFRLRQKGFKIATERLTVINADGGISHPGRFHLIEEPAGVGRE